MPAPPTLLLAKVLGPFAIIVGVAMVIRNREFAEVVSIFVCDRTTRVLVSALELLAGVLLVVAHNAWDSGPAALISLLGWLAVIESTAYLLLPDAVLDPVLRPFMRPVVIARSGLVAVGLGAYLASAGFGVS